ncbi:EAL and HDOD domain-containing protein [Desulfotomaculum sp. 1211_IL3151]|uniref:EAL and HDOD domain-containing protein n=1 Tax=Desulfotomaculum sp. 1211_IL3151 TaxID=3084055 RepID=UPI002FD8DAD2
MELYVARQPIFDKGLNLFGYELLYRSGLSNYYSNLDGDQATSELILNSMMVIGFNKLTRGKRAFVNFSNNLLEQDFATILPAESTVIEVLEDVEPNEKLVNACKRLKRKGYLIALDDFVYQKKYTPLIELADIIKIDFLNTSREEKAQIIKRLANYRIKFLAEKIETHEDFKEAVKLGYTYFQGYFFSKPIILSGKNIPTHKLIYFHILQEINKQDFSFESIERLIKSDLSLSYKLLKMINSSAIGLRTQIQSIKQALTLLGAKGLQRWLLLVAIKGLGDEKPSELFSMALTRAYFCEQMAPKVGLKDRSSELYLIGMLSLIDAILDKPLDEILVELPISEDVKKTLLGESSILKDTYELAVCYEQGMWHNLKQLATKLNLKAKDIIDTYFNALDLSHTITE